MKDQQTVGNNHPYRYPGAPPFTTGQANVFFGRDQDILDLYRLIRQKPLVVLYGKSGLGKSSILNAGIIPKSMETGDFDPVTIHFKAWTEGKVDTPLSITKKIISEGYDKDTFLDRLLPDDTSLWYHVKTRQIHNSKKQNSGQLLILFDQFEELFTYPAEAIKAFKEEVSELLNTGIPLRFRRMADANDFLTDEEEDFLEEPLAVHQLFGIRSDRLHLIHQLADRLPNILRNMFELKALQPADAKNAILLPAQVEGDFRTPPFEWTPDALALLLAFLQDADNEQRVEGIMLQLLCQYFEEKMVEGEHLTCLDASHLGKLEDIVKKYYHEKITNLGDEKTKMAARTLIEEGLVLEGENIRLSLHESQIKRQYKVDTPLLERLVDSRLLRSEPFLRGGYSYELAHDRLVPAVVAAKQQRRAAEAEKEQRKKEQELAEAKQQAEKEQHLREKAERGQKRANIFTILAVVGLGIAAWQMIVANKNATQIDILNKELENAKLKRDDENSKFFAELNEEITTYVPDSIILKSRTINKIKKLELEGLIQNIFSPIKSQRLSSTEILTTKWTKDENLIPSLLDYSKDRFGEESYNKSGIINTIVVLNRMEIELLEQNRKIVSEFIVKVEQLEDRNQTQEVLKSLKNKMG